MLTAKMLAAGPPPAGLFSGLETQAAGSPAPWDWLAGLLLAGTVVPLAGFTALWVVWREA